MNKTNFLIIVILILGVTVSAQVHRNPFEATPNPNEKVTYKNPIIPGFYSDPSVCRVGEDYYLVTSTFEFFPGVPVFHSKDLVNWEQIGHCIHREEQLPNGINIFACTIRYQKNVFYMITTNTGSGGNFYVTATNPAGPWSDPVWIDVPGIDPDLFFDDDGKAYVISSPFELFEIDLKEGKLLNEGRKVYHGTGGRYAEGPHIYKKDDFYYLLASEGGTEEAHSVTIARSNSIWGPYSENPANPILAHANAAGQNIPIQGVGHADIVQAHDNSWWMVHHGYRKSIAYPVHHILGRETCLVPVTWPKNGWPVVNGNGTAPVEMTCETLPLIPFPEKLQRDEFENENLGLEWNFIQTPVNKNEFIEMNKGALHLKGKANNLGEEGTPAFVGRRLQHLRFIANTELNFNPKNKNEEAGMALLNNGQHFDILVKKSGNKRVVYARLQFGAIVYTSKEVKLKDGPVTLQVKGEGQTFSFAYSQGADFIDIESVDVRFLSTQTVGWFTGVYVGLYATGNGTNNNAIADYEFFEYIGKQNKR